MIFYIKVVKSNMKKVGKVLAYIILAVISFLVGYYLSYKLAENEKKNTDINRITTTNKNIKGVK